MEYIPQPAQVILIAAGLIALGYMLIKGAVRLFQAFSGKTDPVFIMLSTAIGAAIDGAYMAIQDQLSKLAPAEQLEAVKQLAKDIYAQLPAVVVIPIGKGIPLPLKLLISEEMFINICVASYYKTTDALEELEKLLAEEYSKWKAQGKPMAATRLT